MATHFIRIAANMGPILMLSSEVKEMEAISTMENIREMTIDSQTELSMLWSSFTVSSFLLRFYRVYLLSSHDQWYQFSLFG